MTPGILAAMAVLAVFGGPVPSLPAWHRGPGPFMRARSQVKRRHRARRRGR
jgi:hypothetical protein